ncbi:MAG: thioredoxin domain-containing protein [Nitrospirae bacterium]|nr:thioredoxin domain-containing protein [Nitrospirota bacterium]
MSSRKYWVNLIISLLGIGIIFLYYICGESCSYLRGSIFSIDLKYIGLLYIGLLIIFNLMRRSTILLILLSFGLGSEIYLLFFQIKNEIICYYCISFGAVILTLFLLNFDMSKKVFIGISLIFGFIFFSIFLKSSITPLYAEEVLIPSFGGGKTIVRLYTDYFCGPCSKLEPKLKPLIVDLIKNGKINITFVDTPIHTYSSLYARYFLYILNEKKEFEHAIKARDALFEAAKNNIKKKELIEDFLKKKNIKFRPFNVSPTFTILNGYFKEDKINATPTCVIFNGERKSYTGYADIIKALQGIK